MRRSGQSGGSADSAYARRMQSAADPAPREVPDAREPTFDQDLLSSLEQLPPELRASDGELIREIASEFAHGFATLAGIGPAVTVFGSARTPPEHPDYALAREVGARIGRAGYAVITGGGPGSMEAANSGARDVGAPSAGSRGRDACAMVRSRVRLARDVRGP